MTHGLNKSADVFVPQTNGSISDSLLKNWTIQAFECYSINCDCSKCSIKKSQYSFVCQMPKVVNELIKNNIKPDLDLMSASSF